MTDLPSLIPDHDLLTLVDVAFSTPPGAFVELGVYQGGSAQRLYELAKGQGRTLHLFDTFAGHTQSGEKDHANHPNGRFADCIDPDELQRLLPLAKIHRGTFPDSYHQPTGGDATEANGTAIPGRTYPPDAIGQFRPWVAGVNIAFVHADLDLYEPTKAACQIFPPRMVSGGVILFDDYFHDDCPGVRKAVDEAFPDAKTYKGRCIWRKP